MTTEPPAHDPLMPPPEEYAQLLEDVRWRMQLLFWDDDGPEAQGPGEALSNLRTATAALATTTSYQEAARRWQFGAARRAQRHGVAVTKIAEEMGVTRESAYRALRNGGDGP